MKTKNLFYIFALSLALTACGDDEPAQPDYSVPGGTGVWTTTAFGAHYATDTVNVTLEHINAELLRIRVDKVTGSPAREGIPAQMMTDILVDSIRSIKQADGSYALRTDTLIGGGTMRGHVSHFRQGGLEGTLEGRKLTFKLDYKFTPSPMEPLLSSTYEGTYKN